MLPPTPRRLVLVLAALALGLLLAWAVRNSGSSKSGTAPTAAQPVVAPESTVKATPKTNEPAPVNSPAPVASVAAADFRAQVEAARALRNPAQHALEFGRSLQAWIARDPDAVLAYVRQLAPSADRTQGLLMVLAAIGRLDPDRAIVLANELTKNREERAIYSSLFAQLAAGDPASAVSKLEQMPAGEGRDNALRAVADGWVQTDLPAALAWAQKLGTNDRATAMEVVLATLAKTDPVHAIDLAQQNLTGAAFERTLVSALQSLTQSDPKTAAALVTTLSPGAVQSQAALSVARALATSSPSDALTWAQTLPAGELRGKVLNNILDVWVAKDPGAAGQYVVQMPAGAEQSAAVAHLAAQLAGNPGQAIAWAQSLANDSARQAAVVNLASAWAQREPAAAAQWAGSLTPVETRIEALNGALSYWLLQDSNAAQNFIFGLSGDTQVSAAAHLAPGLAQRDPVGTIAWAQTLPSAEAREAAIIAAYARWMNNAPVEARAWLVTSNLSAETKAKLVDH